MNVHKYTMHKLRGQMCTMNSWCAQRVYSISEQHVKKHQKSTDKGHFTKDLLCHWRTLTSSAILVPFCKCWSQFWLPLFHVVTLPFWLHTIVISCGELANNWPSSFYFSGLERKAETFGIQCIFSTSVHYTIFFSFHLGCNFLPVVTECRLTIQPISN